MEIKVDNYLINYYANSSDFRIIIYNDINNKKYETIKISDDYKMYKDIGLDIFEIIKNCLDNNTLKIIDNNDYLILELHFKELIKLSINCDNIRINKKEIEIFELKNEINELKNIIKNQNKFLDKLKIYTELITIDNTVFNKNIEQIHLNKIGNTFNTKYWIGLDSSKLLMPVISGGGTSGLCYKNEYVQNIEYNNTIKQYNNGFMPSIIIKTPDFEKYNKYPEIPKIYFSNSLSIKELAENLLNLNFIGFCNYYITSDDITNLLNLKKLNKVKFYNCTFNNITPEKIILLLDKINVIFEKA